MELKQRIEIAKANLKKAETAKIKQRRKSLQLKSN